MKIHSIKNKILGSVTLIITLSLTAISILAFRQFSSILENQALKDDVIHLDQTTIQMNQLIDDVYKYSANMINDELLVQFASRLDYPSKYDELDAYQEVVRQLTKFNVLRNYLHSSAIIRSDGKVFWSSLVFDPYYTEVLQEDWYQDALRTSSKSGFTSPHELKDQGSETVISYFIRFDSQYGGRVLLLNISYEAFTRPLISLDQSFDHFALKDQNGKYIFNEGISSESHATELATTKDSVEIQKLKDGYYLNSSLERTGWSLITYTSNDRFQQLLAYVISYWVVFMGLCLITCFLLFLPIVSSIIRPISQMSKAMKQVSMGNYNIQVDFHSNDELNTLKTGFERMLSDIKRQMDERAEQEQVKRRMSAELLFAQINPHFIYNTLNTVVYLAKKGNHIGIEEMVESFIGILHDAVKIGESDLFITVEQEIELINHYVRIQKYRYADRFDLEWNVDEDVLNNLIPKSILQPIVENSIYHGFSEKETDGHLKISIHREQDKLIITIKDDGIGMSPETVNQIMSGTLSFSKHSGGLKHIGLHNIYERIEYLYNDAWQWMINSAPKEGTSITIILTAKPDIPK